MKTLTTIALLAITSVGFAKGQEIQFETSDAVTVYGEIYRLTDTPMSAPLILLFHQGGGDTRGEYTPLVVRLIEQGYNLVAIDQRRGGDRFGGNNRTLAGVGDVEYSYCDVYPDLEGALRFAREYGFTGLVFKLGTEHPDEIDAVLAFSAASGSPMDGCRPEPYSERITQPVLALRPINEMEVPYVPGQMQLFREHGHLTYIADPGVHGSSMLNETRVGTSTEATWSVVLAFLAENLKVQE
jgi:pimeloyl-ACP methyl ester carboxylesterase